MGIHLTLNSEWENIKWGPLTKAPSLVDQYGHSFAMTWPDEAYSSNNALGTANWQLNEEELAWHIGAENDGLYRAAVTKALTDKNLHEVIARRNIKLLGYRDLQFWH